jgi:hypothetical protein
MPDGEEDGKRPGITRGKGRTPGDPGDLSVIRKTPYAPMQEAFRDLKSAIVRHTSAGAASG